MSGTPGVGGGPALPVHLRGDADETACGIHLADAGPSLALAASVVDVTCPTCRAQVEAPRTIADGQILE